MPYVVGALVLVGAVAMLNLIFTLGVVRRLREHSQLLAQPRGGGSSNEGLFPPGERIDDFTARTVDGAVVTRDALARGVVVAFFSPNCQPCIEKVPDFVEYAAAQPEGASRVFAVVAAADDFETKDMVRQLSPVATVLAAKDGQPMLDAFKGSGFPAIYVMGDAGVVESGGHTLSHLPVLTPARV
ncbi:TlpA disulfide reductase family protein [Micromonospora maritima]|uniref:TlpA disulfide reductase family protein n=1 Tax=Micromonospora maritima TaxID=986711 RepID=UPI00157D4474|nr:TlpA disulfide reductase family protein [Micromonospora maritima]